MASKQSRSIEDGLPLSIHRPGEARLEFPESYRTVRDQRNEPISTIQWTSGSVRVLAEQ